MKKNILLLSVVLGIAALVVAAEEAKTNDKSQQASSTEHRVLNPSDLTWGDMPPGLPVGAKMAVLNGNPGAAGPFTARMNAPAGYTIAPHTHPTTERITVISGSFRVGMGTTFSESNMKDLGPGSYIVLPSGMAHFAKVTTDSIIQIDSEGPFQINYVNPADDPRGAKK